MIKGFQHFHIPLDDVYDSNILEYFPQSNGFIDQGLKYWSNIQTSESDLAPLSDTESDQPRQSGVLVHW